MRLTISEAAYIAKYSDSSALRHAIKNGFLKADKPSPRVTLIDSAELERWMAAGKPIWPKSKQNIEST